MEVPVPLTRTDEILVALHAEIAGLRADLKAERDGAPAALDGQVLLEEPKPAKSTRQRPKG